MEKPKAKMTKSHRAMQPTTDRKRKMHIRKRRSQEQTQHGKKEDHKKAQEAEEAKTDTQAEQD